MNEGEQFIVEKVTGKKVLKGKIMYYVKWKGFPENENTWEPIDNFQDPKPYQDYENSLNKKNKKKNKKITKNFKNETSTESLLDIDDGNLNDENKIRSYFLRKKKKGSSIQSDNEKNKTKKEKNHNFNDDDDEEEFEEKSINKEEKSDKEIKKEKIENEKENEEKIEIKKKEGKLGINPLNKIKHCYINKDDNKNHFFCVEFKSNNNEEFTDAIFTFEELIKVEPELLARYLIEKATFKIKK